MALADAWHIETRLEHHHDDGASYPMEEPLADSFRADVESPVVQAAIDKVCSGCGTRVTLDVVIVPPSDTKIVAATDD